MNRIPDFDTIYYAKSMMEKGASGYLLKNASEIVLKEALLPRRHQELQPNLTRREKDILKLIMQEYTSQQIADTLHLSLRTVENQRTNLMQKMDVKNAVGLVKKTIEWKLLE